MPGFTSRDDLMAEMLSNGKVDQYDFHRKSAANTDASGLWTTLWNATGAPSAGANPAATPGTVYESDPTSRVTGAIDFPDRSTDQRYLLSFGAFSTMNCTLMLYDRLAGVGGISLATTGAKTVNSGALTRYSGADAILNEAWLEITTATTVSATTFNLNSYTSADGTTSLNGDSISVSSGTDAGTMFQLPLNAFAQGVRSVEAGLNVSAAATAGAGNIVIIRPLARIGLYANTFNEISFLDDVLSLPRIYDNACLSLAVLATAATSVTVRGNITCVYG